MAGSGGNSQAYIDHYKDAFITFTRHRFDEALGKLELCEEMLADTQGGRSAKSLREWHRGVHLHSDGP